ncbi:hypothetical protein [Psychrobacter sp. FDAARGOS_221]|uniref:hypothetical protein n=1 Tax=Psychrobacter sp. FDAARGOS_221 TaxID=1975705 RepID=UPI000BB59969|nr:hypothetical protein [Psychrobacter sp. FDAARGOS_221]PNK61512.1 hypothetical protein A6J60_011990 [Psychrobacter sp. FDAARGOS_221]
MNKSANKPIPAYRNISPYQNISLKKWMIVPTLLFILFCLNIIIAPHAQISVASYWQSQMDTFLFLNTEALTVLPAEVWGNINMLCNYPLK